MGTNLQTTRVVRCLGRDIGSPMRPVTDSRDPLSTLCDEVEDRIGREWVFLLSQSLDAFKKSPGVLPT